MAGEAALAGVGWLRICTWAACCLWVWQCQHRLESILNVAIAFAAQATALQSARQLASMSLMKALQDIYLLISNLSCLA
jgi:hypothetical protein